MPRRSRTGSPVLATVVAFIATTTWYCGVATVWQQTNSDGAAASSNAAIFVAHCLNSTILRMSFRRVANSGELPTHTRWVRHIHHICKMGNKLTPQRASLSPTPAMLCESLFNSGHSGQGTHTAPRNSLSHKKKHRPIHLHRSTQTKLHHLTTNPHAYLKQRDVGTAVGALPQETRNKENASTRHTQDKPLQGTHVNLPPRPTPGGSFPRPPRTRAWGPPRPPPSLSSPPPAAPRASPSTPAATSPSCPQPVQVPARCACMPVQEGRAFVSSLSVVGLGWRCPPPQPFAFGVTVVVGAGGIPPLIRSLSTLVRGRGHCCCTKWWCPRWEREYMQAGHATPHHGHGCLLSCPLGATMPPAIEKRTILALRHLLGAFFSAIFSSGTGVTAEKEGKNFM